jgi:CDP-diacylglycerol--glycerol-3-phosphate 3-phosphatidyltransferase
MTWTSVVGRVCGGLLDAIVRMLALTRINPNVLTVMGLVVNTYAAFLFGYATGENQRRMFFYAGLVIIGSGFFDLVDGRVALVMISSIMVSYARARAESLIGTCRVGFMERPERLVLLIIGALFNVMAPVLWVIAVLSTVTVIHRITHTWRRTKEMEASAAGRAA